MPNTILSITNSKGRQVSLLNDDVQQQQQQQQAKRQNKNTKRRYYCAELGCHKSFTTSGHLARHNRIHTGEKNFHCLYPGCPSRFSRQDNMMQHYRTHLSYNSRQNNYTQYIECSYAYYSPAADRHQAPFSISDGSKRCYAPQQKNDDKRNTMIKTSAYHHGHDLSADLPNCNDKSNRTTVNLAPYPSPIQPAFAHSTSEAHHNENICKIPLRARMSSSPFTKEFV